MKKCHVTVFYVHASGSEWVSPDESEIIFARAYAVNAVLVDLEWGELHFTPFGEIHLKKLTGDQLDRHPAFVEPYQRLWNSLTADDWLDSTTDDVIVLPVTTIHFREDADSTYSEFVDFLRTPVATG
jgi:hypothetical protein